MKYWSFYSDNAFLIRGQEDKFERLMLQPLANGATFFSPDKFICARAEPFSAL
jgi:hypothetical protein